MPNFLSKLFRGKNEGGKKKPKKKKPSKKEKSSLFNKNGRPSDREALNDLSDVPTVIDGGARRPSFTGTTGSTRGSSLGRESTKANMSSQNGVLSPRNQNPALQPFGNMKTQKQHERENHGFDENDCGDHGADENRDRSNVELGSPTVPRLSHQQLQQFNQQHSDPHSPNALPGPTGLYQQSDMGPSITGKNMQLSRLSTGQLVAMENMSSPVSSSDFCLSTDAEDNEYNAMKHGHLGPPPPHPQGPAGSQYYSGGGGVGGGSALGSPMSYTTDEENSLFPALQTDDEGDPTPNAKHSLKAQAHTGTGQVPTNKNVCSNTPSPHPHDEPGRINMTIHPMAHETEADMRAWTPSPTSGTHSPRDGQTEGGSGAEQQQKDVKATNSPRFTFQDEDELPSKKRERDSGVDRPPSPVPGFAGLKQTVRCNENSKENDGFPETTTTASPEQQARMVKSLGNGSPTEMYPDSTDSEFEPLTASPKEGAAKVDLEKASSLLPTQTIVGDVPPSPDPETSLALVEKKGEQEEGEAPANFFADFDGATFPSETTSQDDPFAIASISKNGGQRRRDSSRVNLLVETARSFSPDKKRQTSRRKLSSSASASNATSPLSQLLAQAKEKRSSRNRNKQSSSSVNSAPVVTASYLRQQHNLKPLADRQDSDSPCSMTDHRHKSGASSSRNASVASRHRSSRLSSAREHHPDARSHHSNTEANSAVSSAKDKLKKRRKEKEAAEGVLVTAEKCSSHGKHQSRSSTAAGGPSDDDNSDNGEAWLFEEVADTLGPRGIAADMESLGGRSNRSGRSKNSTGNKSHRSHRSHRSHKSRGERSHRSSRRHRSSNESIDSRNSRNSRNSRYSHRSTRSHLSHMSEQSRSVANDLLRLEMQLAMVGSQDNNDDGGHSKVRSSSSIGGSSVGGTSIGGASRTSRASRASTSISARRAAAMHKRSKITVIAPPGKLGIILANKADSKGTVVSGVRTSSVLAEKISPGDRITAIDGEDVSRMTVSEITTIMARKSDFERTLTVLTTPKQLSVATGSSSSMGQGQGQASKSPTRGGEYGGSVDVDSLAGSSVANSSFSYRH